MTKARPTSPKRRSSERLKKMRKKDCKTSNFSSADISQRLTTPKRRSSSRLRKMERKDYRELLNIPLYIESNTGTRNRKQGVSRYPLRDRMEKPSPSTKPESLRSSTLAKRNQRKGVPSTEKSQEKPPVFRALVRRVEGVETVDILRLLLAVKGPITRSMGTLRDTPMSAICWQPEKRKTNAAQRNSNAERKSPKNVTYVVKDHTNSQYRDFRFHTPLELIARRTTAHYSASTRSPSAVINGDKLFFRQAQNNTVSGEFVLGTRKAHEILKKLPKPYTVKQLEIAVKQAFVDITPYDYDLALRQLIHSVICNEGVLAFTDGHGLPHDSCHIVKEETSEMEEVTPVTPSNQEAQQDLYVDACDAAFDIDVPGPSH